MSKGVQDPFETALPRITATTIVYKWLVSVSETSDEAHVPQPC